MMSAALATQNLFLQAKATELDARLLYAEAPALPSIVMKLRAERFAIQAGLLVLALDELAQKHFEMHAGAAPPEVTAKFATFITSARRILEQFQSLKDLKAYVSKSEEFVRLIKEMFELE